MGLQYSTRNYEVSRGTTRMIWDSEKGAMIAMLRPVRNAYAGPTVDYAEKDLWHLERNLKHVARTF